MTVAGENPGCPRCGDKGWWLTGPQVWTCLDHNIDWWHRPDHGWTAVRYEHDGSDDPRSVNVVRVEWEIPKHEHDLRFIGIQDGVREGICRICCDLFEMPEELT